MNTATFFLLLAIAQPPALPDGTEEARASIARLQKVPENFRVEVWAAEPMLGNPVAFSIDEKGRIYTAESYRFNRGTEEYRHRPFFLEGDLQNSTVEQRLEMYKKFADKFPGGMDYFTKHSERIRLLEDTKGWGRADKATTFADGFNDALDGLAAGVLPRDGDVYFTCIPHLWKLRDDAGKGLATKQKLLSGFGVQTAFLGHDLHGLIFGPDGKLYFSVGDRGFHVTTKEGKTLSGPRTGAVFRCDPDGANLEVIHIGLRNPQELAFDQYGNLFAADNNCDKGDHSRLVYIVEGGDSGWRMDYQTMEAPYLTGPWHAEKLWHLPHEGQPAWIVPPVGKLGAGPSGFTFTSGLGLPARYKNAFLMCNFSSSKGGGIDAFRVVPKGAGFELVDYHQFLGPGLITDCEQGYDGKLYYSDWVQFTWDGGGTGKGRIFSAYDPKALDDPAVARMKRVFAEGFKQRETKELIELLRHPDMRVRLRAQYELAARKATAELAELAKNDADQLVRIHAIWGLGQIAGHEEDAILELTWASHGSKTDEEIRAQVAKVMGDRRFSKDTTRAIINQALHRILLFSKLDRTKMFAIQSLGKAGYQRAAPDIFDAIYRKSTDPILRHVGIVALDALLKDSKDFHSLMLVSEAILPDLLSQSRESPGALVQVLLLRRWQNTRVSRFLHIEEVETEAARAIYDIPINGAMSDLANLSPRIGKNPHLVEALGRRIINANFRLGGDEHARVLLDVVTNPKVSDVLRGEALACLSEWATPGPRDRVIGAWRPLPPRSPGGVRKLVESNLETLLGSASGAMQADVVKLIAKLDVKVDEDVLASWVKDAKKGTGTRVESLRLLVARQKAKAIGLLYDTLKDEQPRVRAAARDGIADVGTAREAMTLLIMAYEQGAVLEQQSAIRTLARIHDSRAAEEFETLVDGLIEGKIAAALQLDVLQAAKTMKRDSIKAKVNKHEESLRKAGPLGPYRMTMEGGDAERGKHLFGSHATGQCIRCHKIKGEGGDVGPDLSEWAPKANREHLLESLILPDKKITPGYGTVTLSLDSGKIVTGVLRSEDKDKVVLLTPDQKTVTIPTASIDFRSDPKSAMPAMGQVLSLEEMRDIIQYLSELKKQ